MSRPPGAKTPSPPPVEVPVHDKDDAIPALGATTFEPRFMDTLRKAGDHDVDLTIMRSGGSPVPSPDSSTTDDAIATSADVHGVDLRITSYNFAIEGGSGCGATPSTPCPNGAVVLATATYQNVGDPEADTAPQDEARRPDWKAAVYRTVGTGEPELIQSDASGRDVLVHFHDVPPTTLAAQGIWGPGQHVRLSSDHAGGKHVFEIRLDHPDNYQFNAPPSTAPDGRVAERTDGHECPGPGDPVDNVVCVTLYFATS